MGCLYGSVQKVAIVPALGTLGNVFQVPAYFFRVPDRAEFFKAFNLRIPYGGIVNGEYVQRVFLGQTILVQAYNGFSAGINVSLAAGSAFLDTHLRKACGNSLGHATQDSTSWIWAQDRLIISLVRYSR